MPASVALRGMCTVHVVHVGLTIASCWLQVWLGQKVEPAFDSPAWAAVLSGKAAPLWQGPAKGQSPDKNREQSHGNSANASIAESSAEQCQHPGDSIAIPGRQRGAVGAVVELPPGVTISIMPCLSRADGFHVCLQP